MTKRNPNAQEVPEPPEEQLTGQTSLFDPTIGQSIVRTATGKEFILPRELEEYKTDNPIGAEEWVRNIKVPSVDPRLDINSEEFDVDAWAAAFEARYSPEGIRTRMEGLSQLTERLSAFIFSDLYTAMKGALQELKEWYKENEDFVDSMATVSAEMRQLFPFLKEVLEEAKQDPQYKDITIQELLKQGLDEKGNPTESKWQQLIEKAKARKEEYDKAKELVELAESLPVLQSLKPDKHTMPNNPLMNTLQQKPAINAGPFDMVVANEKGRRKEITAYTMVDYDPEDTGVTITDCKLTEYERQVSDAVISLYLDAVKKDLPPIFTADMVHRAMPGGGDKPSPQQKGAITKTIEKLRRLHITVDATEEMQKRGIKDKKGNPVTMVKFDGFYLSVTHMDVRVKNGGHSVSAYKILGEPIVLTYSKMTSQILTVDAKYLEIKKVKKGKANTELVTMNAGRQAMTGYMLRRIAVMKRDKKNKVRNQSNTILFETLFKEAGTTTTDRKQTGLNRTFCFEVLDYWKATGFIQGYKQQTKGKRITGIEISL